MAQLLLLKRANAIILHRHLRQNYAMKIPTPKKRGHAWRTEFMHNGKRYSATHDTQAEAKEWAAREMLRVRDDAKKIDAGELPDHTLTELARLYIAKVSAKKKGGTIERKRIANFLQSCPKLAAKTVASIGTRDLIAWRNHRMTQVSDSTVRREINLLSSIFNYAVKELLWLRDNPFNRLTRPQSAQPRFRRVSDAEYQAIMAVCGYVSGMPQTSRQWVGWCFAFAIETAMRASEIMSMTWANVHDLYVYLPDTKNGSGRNVPLLQSASDMLGGLDRVNDRVVQISGDSLKNIFRRVCRDAGIVDMHFHDSRHEAATRLARLLDVKDLAKVTGHKDISTLLNTYYNPTANELAVRMRAGVK